MERLCCQLHHCLTHPKAVFALGSVGIAIGSKSFRNEGIHFFVQLSEPRGADSAIRGNFFHSRYG
jgi:hypothetical protein